MVDNIAVTPGTGVTVAADDVGGVFFQKVKLDMGGDGASSPLGVGQQAMAASVPVALASNQSAIPTTNAGTFAVQTASALLDITLSTDTSAYADGDLLADTQAVTSAFRVNDGTGVLQSIQVLDEDDQGVAMDLVFLSANNTLGTENSAPSVSDANARDILGRVNISSGDYIDLGGCRIATKTGIGLLLKAASGTTTLYVAAITRGGTPTYTASGLRLRLGILQD